MLSYMTSLGGNIQKFVPTRGLQVGYAMGIINSSSPNNSDSRDFGIYGLFGNGGSYNYGGIYRDATTKKWTVFTSTAAPDYVTGAATSSLAGFTKANIDINTLYSSVISNSGAATIQGLLTVVGQIAAADGSAAAPGISFSNELGSGIFRASTGRVAISSLGTSVLDANATRILLPTCGIYAPNSGTININSPSYAFSSSTSTGHRFTGSSIIFSNAGTDILDMAPTASILYTKLYVTNSGSASAPDIVFNDGSGAGGIYGTGSAATLAINFSIASSRICYINSTGFIATQVSTGVLTNSGAISVTAAINLNSNNLTTAGTISTAVLTSAATLSVTAPLNLNSNNISGVGILSLSTLTGSSTIAVSQNMDMGANTLNASAITGNSSTVTFNSGNGKIVAGNSKFAASVKTANYTILATDYMIEFQISSAATCTLPAASGVIGQRFVIILNGTGNININCAGGDTFQYGGTTINISTNQSAIHLAPNAGGTFWITL